MERLWAPWRMAYIEGIGERDGCFLCEASKAAEPSADNLVLFRDELVVCIMNRFPYNNGHLLVAPCSHEGDLEAITEEERAAVLDGLIKAKGMLARTMRPDGFNVGLNLGRAAGAGLAEHLHFHIVPRWNGDTNFMPILSDTKVIPQALRDLHGLLSKNA